MIIQRNRFGLIKWQRFTFLLLIMLIYPGINCCTPDLTDDPIPFQPFSAFTVNLNLPEYQNLRTDGGWKYINEGVRGIIVYRESAATYFAYERNCSYQPNSACATVEVHLSNLYMNDPCCNSSFDFSTGLPTGGPAWRPLNRYETILNGSDLTITDTLVE